jgi:hypothetical protein
MICFYKFFLPGVKPNSFINANILINKNCTDQELIKIKLETSEGKEARLAKNRNDYCNDCATLKD